MKKFIFFAQVGLFLIFAPIQSTVLANRNEPDPDLPYYVIIGAFAYQNNAVRFTDEANRINMHAKFALQGQRNLYYVYVLMTPVREVAMAEGLRLRKESKYSDTWVFHGVIGKPAQEPEEHVGIDINPENSKPINVVTPEEHKVAQPIDSTTVVNVTPKRTEEKLTAGQLEERSFIFELYRATDSTIVEGEVDEIDVDKSRKMASYKANQPVKVAIPTGKTGGVSFIAEVMGYRKTQRDFNFSATDQHLTVDHDGNIIIPFELIRLQKGDIAVMYNVFFYKDAAIMRPESRFEVNNLLAMLKENSKYKIKIHGHTNGNAHGKIITMGESKNFFSLTDTRDGFGSAKKLSFERAEAIKQYLISNGIETERMLVKAWGGKRPIHDKNAARAQENVRVEIEILEQ